MTLLRRNSFIVGFLSALLVVAAVYLWLHAETVGGIHAESPNGNYELMVMAPLTPKSGGAYSIELRDMRTSSVVRRIVVSMPRSESTVALRGGGGTVVWDASNSFADITIDGASMVRVWVPQSPPSTALLEGAISLVRANVGDFSRS